MKKPLIISGICLAVLATIFMSTDPSRVPSFILIIPFLLLFAALFLFSTTMLQWQGMGKARSMRLSALFAGIPILLLVLQSIGQLTVRDVLTIAVLLFVSYFYVTRATASS
jgi:hypothetical protein